MIRNYQAGCHSGQSFPWILRAAGFWGLSCLLLTLPVRAQTPNYVVTSGAASGFGSLADAIATANASTESSFLIQINPGLTIQPDAQLVLNPTPQLVSILGGNSVIDMSLANSGAGDRAFFIASGNINISDLTISNGVAKGGNGGDGGGGGAGLGGGLFIANLSGVLNFYTPPSVTLNNVSFSGNSAHGGNGGIITVSGAGGGGGMGGNGGVASSFLKGGGGGGGIPGLGNSAEGGTDGPGTEGGMIGFPGGGSTENNSGGINGGGGAGATGSFDDISGGGGGINGQPAQNSGLSGGTGGFGGGGGGSGFLGGGAGFGGFGGGGGGGDDSSDGDDGTFGGNGGFGGGGGYGELGNAIGAGPGVGGFGGGVGSNESYLQNGQGGGGLGAGGGIFVMDGASLTITGGNFNSNSVQAGLGFVNGSAYGTDLFLGADVTFNIPAGQTISMVGLGGAGNTSDANILNSVGGIKNSADADGGIIKTGSGELVLSGENFYSGPTVVNQGTLTFGPNSSEAGTSSVVVGVNPGDDGTLVLSSGASLSGAGILTLGQEEGASGTLVFSGSSLGTLTGFTSVASGNGAGTVVFAPDEGATFTIDTSFITGGTTLTHNGPGTTLIQPAPDATGTYAGSTFVLQGTLQIGTPNAIAFSSPVFVRGGVLDLYGSNLSLRELFVTGGTVLSSQNFPLLELDFLSTTSGTIGVSLNTGSDFQLTQDGPGTTTLTGNNLVQDSLILIEQGQLLIAQEGGQLRNAESIRISGNSSLVVQGGSGAGLDAILSGVQSLVVGVNDGDNASLIIDGKLLSSNSLVLGQSAGAFGSVSVGASATRFEAASISSGDGGGELTFGPAPSGTQAAETITVNAEISGNISLVVDTGGTTVYLQPLNPSDPQYAALNSYTGNTIINSGTLQTAVIGSIASTNNLTVNSGGTLLLGSNQTLASLQGDGTVELGSFTLSTGSTNSTFAGQINGDGGLVKQGGGTLILSGNNTYSSPTMINEGTLVVNGSLAGDVTVAQGATLGGSGTIGALGGAGSVSPGNSPGILTATSVDPSAAMAFEFEFTSLQPNYANPLASANDVLRLNSISPFDSPLSSANTVNFYFSNDPFVNGIYTGGFFTDQQTDFFSQVQNATFNFYRLDSNGSIVFNSQTYAPFSSLYTIQLNTVLQIANFEDGSVEGRVLQIQIVPEPNTSLLAAVALLVLWMLRKRQLSARK